MAEFSLNGRTWRTGKLDALTQLAIAVKLMPIIPALQPVLAAAAKQREAVEAEAAALVAGADLPVDGGIEGLPVDAITSLGTALTALGDDGRNYIIGACMKAVMMQIDGGGFLPAWNARDNAPDASIDVVTLLQLVYRVVMDNIASFSTALGSKSPSSIPGAV